MTAANAIAIVPRRSFLFVPALRPDRFDKAAASGADMFCVDLEDAVAPDRKDEARGLALPYFEGALASRALRYLRINSPRIPEGLRDLLALLDAKAPPDGVALPKVRSAEEVRWVDGLLRRRWPEGVELLIQVEEPEAVENAYAIAAACPRVAVLAFGFVDFAAEVGCALSRDALLVARSRIAWAARRQGIDALDGPWLEIRDTAGLEDEARHARALGYSGKIAIHPNQIAGIHRAFTPSEAEVARARRIVAAFEAAGGNVVQMEGEMIEAPVVAAAQRTLAAAAADAGMTEGGGRQP